MKPPTGRQIGEEILLDKRSDRLTEGSPTLKSLRSHLAPLHAVIPKSVINDGVPAQLSWIYEVFRKGAPDDHRASLPHEDIIEEMIILLSLSSKILNDPASNAPYLEFWAKKKKARANAKGGNARAKKAAENIAKNFLPYKFRGLSSNSDI